MKHFHAKALPCLLAITAWLAIAGLTESCTHHDLCLHHRHEIKIRIVYDWRYSPDACPEGMTAYFYREGSDRPIRVDFTGSHGGEISLPTGRYRIISYNNDCKLSQFGHHDDFAAHMTFTRQGNILEPLNSDMTTPSKVNGQNVVICPDDIYLAKAIEVEIREDGISYICVPLDDAAGIIGKPITSEEQVIYLYPQDVLCRYSYEVRHVEGVERIRELCGSISGMCPSLKIASLEKHMIPVVLPYAAEITGDGRIVGEFLTFGHHPEVENPHNMELYVWTNSGSSHILGRGEENFNVTGQVHDAPNPRRVHLVIDHIAIPADENAGCSGQTTSADDWFEVDTPILL